MARLHKRKERKMKKPMAFSTVPYEVGLKRRLANAEYALGYLKAGIEESAADMPEAVLAALKNVADAHGMTWLSKKTGIPRQTLYQMLSKDGNPSFRAFLKIAESLGLRIFFDTLEPKKRAG